MFNWPARLFQKKGANADAALDQAVAYPRIGDTDVLYAADRALRAVLDPELGINIVDLGPVCRLSGAEGRIEAEIRLTSPSCPHADHIAGLACEALWAAIEDAVAVKVTLAAASHEPHTRLPRNSSQGKLL